MRCPSPRDPRRRPPAGLAAIAWLAIAGPAGAQVTFEGLVTDDAGTPQPDTDLDFFDAQTGVRVDPSAPGYESQDDKTDFQGRFQMVVRPDVYHVRYEPPPARADLAPVMLRNVILGADTVRDVVLPRGARLAGRVTAPGGGAAVDVDLDFRDPVTNERLVTVRDNTAADGRYGTTVLPGIWDVEFRPPVGLGLGPLVVDAFDLRADASLDVTLPAGFTLRGVARQSSGAAVPFADIDVDDPAAQRRVPTANDNTDTAGAFAVAVPAGTFHVFITPPEGIFVAPAARWDVVVQDDLDLGEIVLGPGVLLQGTALDASGAPIAGGNLDLFRPGTCDRYPAAPDTTDAAGRFALRVEPGTYDIVVRGDVGSGLAPQRFEGIVVASSDPIELRAPAGPPPAARVASRLVDPAGAPVAGALVEADPLEGGAAWSAVTEATGAFAADAIPGTYALRVTPPDGSGLGSRTFPAIDVPCGMPSSLTLLPAAAGPAPTPRRALRASPNPWRTVAHVELDLPEAEPDGTLAVFDVAGRLVRRLERGVIAAGLTVRDWDGRDEAGRRVGSGIYFIRLSGRTTRLTAKIARIAP